MALPDYASSSDVKATMPDGSWGSSYDTLLASLVTRASRAIDRYTGREPGAYKVTADSTRYFNGSGHRTLMIDELAAAPTSVAMSETAGITDPDYLAMAATDYILYPYNALAHNLPFYRLDLDQYHGNHLFWWAWPRAVKIVGKFGYAATVPDEIVEATIIQAARWFKRGQQAYADTGAIVDLGQLTYTKRVDPDVAEIIAHFKVVVV